MNSNPSRKTLSKQARRILAYIVDVQQTRGAPPTVREIGRSTGIRSTNGVAYHLDRLEREGWIRRRRGCARGIMPVPERIPLRFASSAAQRDGNLEAPRSAAAAVRRRPPELSEGAREIPILGRIAAGTPVAAEEHREGSLEFDRLGRIKPDFALRVTGDSMCGVGILEGDLVLVRGEPDPADGDIVVALLGEETTVKRFFRKAGEVVLQPENPAYEPIRVSGSHPELRILGKVVGVYREFEGRPGHGRKLR
ncbi:MAG: transcriptional repressor LexA [Candidatus Eisenbacteria bacterium]